MFDPAQLSALSAVLRTGSFERAAQMLHVTQSAISQRVRQLEEQVGTTESLLYRRGNFQGADVVGQGPAA